MNNIWVMLLCAQFVPICLAGTIDLSNSKLSISGKATIKVDPPENFWSGLSLARRFPIILSGDLIALKLARSSGTPYWLRCNKAAQPCDISTCPGGATILSAKFASCPRVVFRIRARGKSDGEPVYSGDHVTIVFPYYGETRFFFCQPSTSGACYPHWSSTAIWTGKHGNLWFRSSQAVFRIFSRNAIDGTPVQFGDVVGFKYDYQSNTSWLHNAKNRFYAKPCSNGQYIKSNCAKMNSAFGFQIYKKL